MKAQRVRDLALVNWPVKLTALALSAVLWAAVAAQQPTSQLVPVTLEVTPPSGRALTRQLPPVKALYVGATRELIKLYGSPPVIRKTIPDTLSSSRYVLELSPSDLSVTNDADAKAQDVQPRTITLTLDDVARRTVPVSARVTIHPDSGFDVVGGIGVTPATVAISGPGALVSSVTSVRTVPLDISDVSGPVTQVVAIDTTGLGVLKINPRAVEVSADIAPISERVLMGVAVTFPGERGSGWESDPPAVIVTVRGPAARLHRLTRDSVQVIAVPLGRGGAETIHLDVIPPTGITGGATPDTAVVQRRPRG